MRVTILGSGTNLHPHRAAAGYLVQTDNLFLMDFGPRTLSNLLKTRVDRHQIQYLLFTHYHADHTWGNYLFPGAKIIAHSVSRQLLLEKGVAALEKAQAQNSSLKNVKIQLPEVTFDQGEMVLRAGKKHFAYLLFPGIVMEQSQSLLRKTESCLPVTLLCQSLTLWMGI